MARQCELLGLAQSTCYYRSVGESAENLALMRAIDEQYLRTPFYAFAATAEIEQPLFNADLVDSKLLRQATIGRVAKRRGQLRIRDDSIGWHRICRRPVI